MFLTKFTLLIFSCYKAMIYTKRFCIKTIKAQLRWRRTSETNVHVIQVILPSYIVLLWIILIRMSLLSSTATHRRCFPTSSPNHYKGGFDGVSGKSLWYWVTSTSCKIISHLQRRSAFKIMFMETNQKSIKR